MNMFDGGVSLTLARFTGPSYLPYRDLWTLYGPGPPVLGSFVSDLFGSGILANRLMAAALQALFVAAAYAVLRRFVAWWWAALLCVPLATFAFAHYFHFVQSLTIVLFGLWFVVRSDDDPERRSRRLVSASVLFGLAFWGRYELAPIGAALVVGLWLWFRPHVSSATRRWILVAGLLPPTLFGVYLLGVVGWERAYLNLVEYPFRFYPRPECRGLPDVWGRAFRALIVPLEGRWWTGEELMLWGGTFLAPVVGVGTVLVGVRHKGGRPALRYTLVAVGLISLVIWLEHRPRASGQPYPVWGLMLVCLSGLLAVLARRRLHAARAILIGSSVVFLTTAAGSWLPAQLPAWADWPAYHSRYGFARGETSNLYDDEVWSEVVTTVQRHVPPADEVFVALLDNRFQFANAPLFYWLVDRPPASRFIEFSPCLTDTARVQGAIVRDLETTEVVITTSFFTAPPPAPLGPPASVLDDYLQSHFRPVYRGALPGRNAVVVSVRTGVR
jgi:hypothetical protein